MPPADQVKTNDRLMRTLAYGVEKSRKSSWALMAAKAGFNVLMLDGDDGKATVINLLGLTAEEKKRIQIVDLTMRADKTVFTTFMAHLLKTNNTFVWDEDTKRMATAFPNKEHTHFKFDLKKFTHNDLVVIDSWKSLCESALFQYADEKDLDLTNPGRDKEDGWDLRGSFGYMNNFLNFVLARLHAFPCHVIVIGHATVYEKIDYTKKPPKMLEQRTQIISSSGPHAKGVPSHFHDVFYFQKISSEQVMIDTGGDKDRAGGSRLFPPQNTRWEDFLPAKVFEKLGAKATGEPCLGAQWFPAGSEIPTGLTELVGLKAATAPVEVKPTPAVIPNSGGGLQLKGLVKK